MVNETADIHSLSSLESEQSQLNNQDPQEINIRQSENSSDNNGDSEKSAETGTGASVNETGLNSTQTNMSTKTNRVPMKDRRGLLSHLAILPEYEDPRDYPRQIKYFIVFIIGFAAVVGPMGTSILLPAIDDVVEDLNTTTILVNISVGIYLLSLGIFPLWWSSLSEKYGRRSIYLISFTLFLGFSIGSAFSPSISALIVFRVLCGGSSASVQAVGAGTIADLYPPDQRGKAMGWYYLGPLMGPFLSPIIGGAVAEAWGWRATQWVLVIAAGMADFLIIFALPETLRKQDNLANVREYLQKLRAQEIEDEDTSDNLNDSISEKDKEKNASKTQEISDKENNLSRLPSLQQIDSMLSEISRLESRSSRGDNEEGLFNIDNGVGDSITPYLSRLDTRKSDYSKRVQIEALQSRLSKELDVPKSKREKWENFKFESYELLIKPLHSLVLLTYPPVILVISHSAICFAAIYFFNITISYEYSRAPYNYSTLIVGLLYIPNSVTYILASIFGGRWNDKLLRKYADKHNGELSPESRISWNLIIATILYIPACLIFGWTLKYHLHWVVPLVGTALFGFSSMLVIGVSVTYLVDTLPGKGATGVALNNLVRQILATIATFVVDPLLVALGPGILYSIILGIILISSFSLVYLKVNGDKLRQKYDISAYYDRL
ncbi:quinidine resistance protein 3 [[Candida] jaroonii]|uniref:Quinidine resistance protein 3 n=1 Tax=[Candida] jaroonii TaxID=467808 RepID=A0ACA9YFC1_9ASCO|nr:quinidine resistance protein 3 [[Candida] jaroonii]